MATARARILSSCAQHRARCGK